MLDKEFIKVKHASINKKYSTCDHYQINSCKAFKLNGDLNVKSNELLKVILWKNEYNISKT